MRAVAERPNSGIRVVGESVTIESARDLVKKERPDILVLDLMFGGSNALDTLPSLVSEARGLSVLIYSSLLDPLMVVRALNAGAVGYVFKSDSSDELTSAIHQVLRGERYLPISRQLFGEAAQALGLEKEVVRLFAQLTDAEREVVRQLRRGLSTRETAAVLGVNEKTVERHRANIRSKHDLSAEQFALLIRTS